MKVTIRLGVLTLLSLTVYGISLLCGNELAVTISAVFFTIFALLTVACHVSYLDERNKEHAALERDRINFRVRAFLYTAERSLQLMAEKLSDGDEVFAARVGAYHQQSLQLICELHRSASTAEVLETFDNATARAAEALKLVEQHLADNENASSRRKS